jgi:quercetin dioxygenase-like cupin family protein
MAILQSKRFESPDETRPFKDGKGNVQLVELAGNMIGYGTFAPGWRWSEHVKPLSGTDSCEVEHVGFVIGGHMKVVMDDGQQLEVGPGDVFHMPPGHDAWTVGEEPCVLLDFGGLTGYAKAG